MANKREFGTGWGDGYPMSWAEHVEEDLIGSSKGGHLMVPNLRPFDFLAAPNQPVMLLRAPDNRASVEALRGTQAQFHRNADFDVLHFQYAGETTYETELGTCTAKPSELVLLPSGTAHRATGTSGSLRLSLSVREPLEVKYDESRHLGHTEYDVTWQGAPNWPDPPSDKLFSKGRVYESVHTWDDRPGEETLVARDVERLVGKGTAGRGLHKIRLFDIFTELTGVRGPGPISMVNNDFFLECYNTVGEQFAYHRGNRSDEAQFQFMGVAANISEFGAGTLAAGELYIQRRGIAHRVKGGAEYRRMVFYSRQRWDLLVDPNKHLRTTRFEVKERILEPAPWREEARKVLAAQRATA
jgi:hypothetical protein